MILLLQEKRIFLRKFLLHSYRTPSLQNIWACKPLVQRQSDTASLHLHREETLSCFFRRKFFPNDDSDDDDDDDDDDGDDVDDDFWGAHVTNITKRDIWKVIVALTLTFSLSFLLFCPQDIFLRVVIFCTSSVESKNVGVQ